MHGVRINYAASYWTPPMTPKLAFDLESRQIEKLDLAPMVSITDHDNIKAPMLLRTVPSARQIPVSVEWSAPYGGVQSFHLGIHNLPSARAAEWMATLEDFTANPSDARLTEILAALHQEPNVLVVFNHPMWDLYLIGKEKHEFLVNEFLQKNGALSARAGTERPAPLGRESRSAAPGRAVEHAADHRRRPARRGAERQHQPDQCHQLYRVRARDPPAEEEQRALHAAVCRAVEASHSAVDDRRDPQLSGVSAGLAHLG